MSSLSLSSFLDTPNFNFASLRDSASSSESGESSPFLINSIHLSGDFEQHSVPGSPQLQPYLISPPNERICEDPNSDGDELKWLHPQAQDTQESNPTSESHEFVTAPLLTREAYARHPEDFPQKGLFGTVNKQSAAGVQNTPKDPRIYMNTSAPFSGLVVGVQGSGKSHSVSVMLENFLLSNLQDSGLGTLPNPLGGLVLHYDTVAEGVASRPCEAAYLACPRQEGNASAEVVILVPPKNLNSMREVYSCVPGAKVAPLYFDANSLSARRMMSLMGLDESDKMPLYMTAALSILRDMGVDGYSYGEFKRRLEEQSKEFNHAQTSMLKLRMDILESLVSQENQPGPSAYFKPGRLVIVDLTDPFLDRQTASLIFDISLGLFVSKKMKHGKVVVLDEAHKYLNSNSGNDRLTETVLALIRQQRHYGLRVLISTQEPTVVPAQILDLVSMVIMHRFSSPSWYHHLEQHVAIPSSKSSSGVDINWLSLVLSLRLGEALVYCPAALSVFPKATGSDFRPEVSAIGPGYFLTHSRKRATRDGGASRMAHGADDDESTIDDNPTIELTDISSITVTQTQRKTVSTHASTSKSSAGTVPTATPTSNPTVMKPLNTSINPTTAWPAPLTPKPATSSRTVVSASISPPATSSSSPAPRRIPTQMPQPAPTPVVITRARIPPPARPQIPLHFKPLKGVLEGRGKVLWGYVAEQLKKSGGFGGHKRFKAFADEAAEAGIVKIGGSTGSQWMQLQPVWDLTI